MKFRILTIFLLLQAVIFSQVITESNYLKLDFRYFSVIPREKIQLKQEIFAPKLNPIERLSDGTEKYGAIIYTKDPEAVRREGIRLNTVMHGYVTAHVTADELVKLANSDVVTYIHSGEPCIAANDVARGYTGADLLNSGYINNTPYTGRGVIIGIIDSGIDWTHGDFRDPFDPSKSRVLYIWDQTLTAQGAETKPVDFTYGVEYTKSQIEDELDGTPAGFVREKDINGHGTHVAGVAAGNGASLPSKKYAGMAPGADLIIVKAGNGSYPQSNVIDALSYIKARTIDLGKPVVVNVSIAIPCEGHDGTDAQSVAMDAFDNDGGTVVTGAGNAGADNIHIGGTIAAHDSVDLTLTVPSYTPASGAGNDYLLFETWFNGFNNITAKIITPSGGVGTQGPGGAISFNTTEGTINIVNNRKDEYSDQEVQLYIYDNNASYPPAPGTWKLRLKNGESYGISFHSWLCSFVLGGGTAVPQLVNGNTDYTLENTAFNAFVVGSFASRWRWMASNQSAYSDGTPDRSDNISSFSSKGPTRDQRQLPTLAAPGQRLGSSKSADAPAADYTLLPGEKHFVASGTSGSSPVVAGAAALLLEYNNALLPQDIKTIITQSCMRDSYTGTSLPDYTWGWGKLDAFMAMSKLINQAYEMAHNIISYDQWNISQATYQMSPGYKVALKFTPSYSGQVGGCFFHTYNFLGITGPLYAEVWNDNGSGLPGSKLGSTVSFDQNKILSVSWNYINLKEANVKITGGQNYYLVLYYNSGSPVTLFADAANVDNRSLTNTGSGWSYLTGDLKIRADVTKDVSGLPVELVSFEAKVSNSDVILNWLTATEVNSYLYEVERMLSEQDVNRWEKIGELKAAGNCNSVKEYQFTDRNLPAGTYIYRLKMIDLDGSYEYSGEAEASVKRPKATALMQNYPNPFNPKTKISYMLTSKGNVRLAVYDILGTEVQLLVDEVKPAGTHSVEFDGSRFSSGIYFYKLTSGDFTQIRKFVMVK